MKTTKSQWVLAVIASTLMLASTSSFGLGSDYPANRPVPCATNWPKGLCALVNTTNRVHGFFVNQEDIFFFSGGAPDLTAFLREFAQLPDVVSRRLILHAGTGVARSPWQHAGAPCDWKLYVCPKGWRNLHELSNWATNSVEVLRQAAREPGYIVEVHFWTGGLISLDQVQVPTNIEIKKE